MKKLTFVVAVLLALAVQGWAKPKIEVPEQHWDLGRVPQKSQVSHAYWIKNIGDDTLKNISVKPG